MKIRRIVLGAAVVASVSALAVPAWAGTPVTVSMTSNGSPSGTGRTLQLQDPTGASLSSLNLSGGSGSFVAEVIDNTYSDSGFDVSATMSNLVEAANGTHDCTQTVPSTAVTLTSPSSLLEADGVASSVVPTLDLSGNLGLSSAILTTLGLSSDTLTNAPAAGQPKALSQAQMAGSSAPADLTAANLTSGTLPLNLAVAAGGAFSSPAADPFGCNAGTNAASVDIYNGAAKNSNLKGDLTTLLNALNAGSAPTAAQAVTAGYLTDSTVMSTVGTALNVTPSALIAAGATVAGIESALKVTVDANPFQGSPSTISGNYRATPKLAVNTTGVPGGQYQGTLTITLADTSS